MKSTRLSRLAPAWRFRVRALFGVAEPATALRCACALTSVLLLVAPSALGQSATTNSELSEILVNNPSIPRNKVGLSYRMGLNITVDFNKLGGYTGGGHPGPSKGSTSNRTYDNGSYNKVDISGNAGGQTWYWGYENSSQIQGNSIVMESTSSPNNGVSPDHQNDPQHGLELSYSREFFRDKHYRVGLMAAFGWTTLDIDDSQSVHTTVNRIMDSFAVPGGVSVIPGAPYHGTFQGPGALLDADLGTSADPSHRTTRIIPQDALVTGTRTVNSDIYTLRIGPYFEVPVYKKLSFTLSGGLTLLVGDTDFSYNENVTILDTGVKSPTRADSGSHTDFIVGGYVEGTLSYAITREVGVFVGAQCQLAGKSVSDTAIVNGQAYTQKESVLDLGESVMVVFGVSYSF